MPKRQIKIPIKQTASGLAVPVDAKVDEPCHHTEVAERVRPQLNQYHCDGCGDKVFFVVLQAALMTQPELEEYQRKMNAAIEARFKEQRRAGLGLIPRQHHWVSTCW